MWGHNEVLSGEDKSSESSQTEASQRVEHYTQELVPKRGFMSVV